jgi:hypothetical protein
MIFSPKAHIGKVRKQPSNWALKTFREIKLDGGLELGWLTDAPNAPVLFFPAMHKLVGVAISSRLKSSHSSDL